jgi:hypothetical protein
VDFEAIEDAADHCPEMTLPAVIRDNCVRVVFLHVQIPEMLRISSKAMML